MTSWLHGYYDDVDNGRIDELTARNTEDLVVQMGGMPPVHGRQAAMDGERQFLQTIRSHRHRFVNVFVDGDTTILEAVVTYTRLDGDEVDVPCTTILHRRGELVDSVRIYLDLAPVYAERPAPTGAGGGR
jgi:ketosteroid isomerase-like protein